MSKYIEREAAIMKAEKYGLGYGSVLGRHSGIADCIASEIATLPAADVVPVVHGRRYRIMRNPCKDCIYYHKASQTCQSKKCATGNDGKVAWIDRMFCSPRKDEWRRRQ